MWFATGFYIVDKGYRGDVLRFGQHVETTMPGPRWHIPFPIESVNVMNMEQVRTVEVGYRSAEGGSGRSKELRESLMLTDDENIIDLQFAVQYNLNNVEDALFNNISIELVETPEDALLTLQKSTLKFLYFSDINQLIFKKENL